MHKELFCLHPFKWEILREFRQLVMYQENVDAKDGSIICNTNGKVFPEHGLQQRREQNPLTGGLPLLISSCVGFKTVFGDTQSTFHPLVCVKGTMTLKHCFRNERLPTIILSV